MKVELTINKNYDQIEVHVTAPEETLEVKNIMHLIKNQQQPMSLQSNQKKFLIHPNKIVLIKSNQGILTIYDEKRDYTSPKKLYEFKALLTSNFLQISKSSIVNVNYIDHVEVSFSGSLKLVLKNGQIDYISRMYVKAFKKYLEL